MADMDTSNPTPTESGPAPMPEVKPATPPMAEPAKPAAPAEPMKTETGGYAKKGNLTKWIIIYVIIAVVLYGGYYLYARSHNSSSNQTNTSIY